MKPTQRTAALLLGLLAILALGFTARAAETSVTVTLTIRGPAPASATAAPGNRIVFSNTDGVTHTIKASSKNWTYQKAIGAKASDSIVLSGVGTYTYSDAHVVLLGTARDDGTITVSKPPASPTPTRSASATPKPSSSASARPSASARVSPTPDATATSSTGVAIGPGIGIGVVPTASPPESGGPQPNVAPLPGEPTPTATSSATGAPVSYSGNGIVQGSAHRYGLPAALAVVAIAGVLSLIVRYLLAHPAAARKAPEEV